MFRVLNPTQVEEGDEFAAPPQAGPPVTATPIEGALNSNLTQQ